MTIIGPAREIIKRTTIYTRNGKFVTLTLSCGHTLSVRPDRAYSTLSKKCRRCGQQQAEEARSRQLRTGVTITNEFLSHGPIFK